MKKRAAGFAKTILWTALFSAAAFVPLKLAFLFVCWIGGHDDVEAMAGLLAPAVFGIGFGIEGYLWFRERRRG